MSKKRLNLTLGGIGLSFEDCSGINLSNADIGGLSLRGKISNSKFSNVFGDWVGCTQNSTIEGCTFRASVFEQFYLHGDTTIKNCCFDYCDVGVFQMLTRRKGVKIINCSFKKALIHVIDVGHSYQDKKIFFDSSSLGSLLRTNFLYFRNYAEKPLLNTPLKILRYDKEEELYVFAYAMSLRSDITREVTLKELEELEELEND